MYVNTSGGEIQFISLHLVLLGQFFLAELQLLYFRKANRLSRLHHSPLHSSEIKCIPSILYTYLLLSILTQTQSFPIKSRQSHSFRNLHFLWPLLKLWAAPPHVYRSGCGLRCLLFWKGAASCFRLRDSSVHLQHSTIKKYYDFYDLSNPVKLDLREIADLVCLCRS